jgi:hypothetical protein
LFWYLGSVAHHECLVSGTRGLLAFAIAGSIHAVDVATSVFGVNLNSFGKTKA